MKIAVWFAIGVVISIFVNIIAPDLGFWESQALVAVIALALVFLVYFSGERTK